ncbi:6372_t:CDS:2, partial [Gigaspora rosea]
MKLKIWQSWQRTQWSQVFRKIVVSEKYQGMAASKKWLHQRNGYINEMVASKRK